LNRIEEVLAEVQVRLGVSRFLGHRALLELRDHLQDSVAKELTGGVDEVDAQETALRKVGTADQLAASVIETSWGLRMIRFFKTRLLMTAALLAAPGILLLGLSFLTFNFPCPEATYMSMGEMGTFQICGVPALETIRPFISEFGIYGGPAWLQWSIHILAVAGPLLAALVILRSQLSFRRRETPDGTDAQITLSLDRSHMVALAATFFIFLIVVVYKAAG
jgi:hypothetical protein